MSDDTAPTAPNALEQSGVADFPIAVKRDSNIQDGFVEVKLKPISGREDQAWEWCGASRTLTTTSAAPTRWKTTSSSIGRTRVSANPSVPSHAGWPTA